MRSGDQSFERLRAALDELAAADVAELLAEARAEARARVRSMLADALAHSMLERAREELGDGAQAPATSAPARARPESPRPDSARPERGRSERGRPESARAAAAEGPSAAPRPDPSPRSVSGAPAWYVYGVLRRQDAEVAAELSGIGGQPVATLADGELVAVTSRVPAEDFEESRLREHLADMAWVEATAREHEGVLDALCRLTTVIPMRMCTVYKTERGVREMLGREANPFSEALEHLEGKGEWGVQAFFFRTRARAPQDVDQEGGTAETAGSAETASGTADAAGGSTGAAYMQRRREERNLDQQLTELVEAAVNDIHERLQEMAVESMLNSPQRPEASGHAGEMVLNGVYLVEDEVQPAFADEVRNLQESFSSTGLELIITGPWPPYNFLPGSIGAAW